MTKKILLVFGTRPEAIKMIPLAIALRAEPELEVKICVTAQHRDMLDQVLTLFDVVPDHDLDIMSHAQGLTQVTVGVLQGLEKVLAKEKPDLVLVHGDTATSMAASLAAFFARVPVGHVEAGLRSGDRHQPWPEEMNRRVVDVIADVYYAATLSARMNLVAENIPVENILVTGNTVIDALQLVANRLVENPQLEAKFEKQFQMLDSSRKLILLTAHRRENFGEPLRGICSAVRTLVARGDVEVVYPVHPNPSVRDVMHKELGGQPHIHLVEPLDYLPFVYLMQRCHMILTDSGGIQEEGPALSKPVFVLRNVTERPEAVAAGVVRLVGTEAASIVRHLSLVLDSPTEYNRMKSSKSPFGDGQACQRIVSQICGRKVEEFQA